MAGFFVKFNNTVMESVKQIGESYQSQFASDMMSLAAASITLFVMWKGYQILAGKVQTPLPDLAWDLSKFAIILTFLTNAGGYLTSATDALEGMKEGFSGGVSIWQTLDNLWLSTQNLADKIYNLDTDYIPLAGAIGMILVWIGSIVLMAVGTVVYLVSDVTMTLLVITAPIFIFCLMWGFLRQMFNNWLQMMFSSILTVLFASMVIRIGMDYQGDILKQVITAAPDSNIVTSGAMGLMAGILAALLVLIARAFAQQLASVGVDGAVQGAAMMGLGVATLGAKKLLSAGKSGGGKAGNAAAENRDRMWNNATPGTNSGGGVAERRKASLENAKRNAA